ncbi:hypothetical protein BGZ83_009987 [Gryganskiella cystojenkinii]|nr:hypothetical protein BGZ83_009987 [Gryganskiella cystojenkinii]
MSTTMMTSIQGMNRTGGLTTASSSTIGNAASTTTTTTTTTSQHSLRQQVRTQITEYSRLTNALFTSLDVLADGKAAPAAPNDIMKQIVQLDATLMGAVEKIELHQRQQQRIRQVRQQIEEQNQAIMQVISSLRESKRVLESNLENLDEKRAVSADARSSEVSINEIVNYANRLSSFTSAPPNFNPADPNQAFEPPYPRELNMRAGILNQQHVTAAALVTLDGSVMPGGTVPVSGVATGPGPGPHGGDGLAITSQPGGGGTGDLQTMANGKGPHAVDEDDDDDYDSGSSSEDERYTSFGRIKEEERLRQQQQQQQQQQQEQQHGHGPDGDEHPADLFDLDL